MTEPQISGTSEELNDPLPALERAVKERPDDAKALVALANHYWLIGAGPEVVGDLASRAIASDPDNRAGWHLWALAESNPRERVARWQQVSKRFPLDDLAKANVADNAAALAGAEHDYQAVDLAIDTYEELLATAEHARSARRARESNSYSQGLEVLTRARFAQASRFGSRRGIPYGATLAPAEPLTTLVRSAHSRVSSGRSLCKRLQGHHASPI